MQSAPLDVLRRRLIPLILTLMAVVAGALSVGVTSASAVGVWSDGPSFGGDTSISVSPVVVGDAAGGVTAAWGYGGSSSTPATVVAQHTSADGTRGPVLQLGTTSWPGVFAVALPDANAPVRIAATASGAVVLWEEPGAASPDREPLNIRFARIYADGTAGPAQTVVDDVDMSPYPSLAPGLAANAAGDVLVSWWSGQDNDDGAFVRRFSADNTATPPVALPEARGPFLALSVAIVDDGTGRVAYGSKDYDLLVGRVKVNGTLDGTPTIVSTDPFKVAAAPVLKASGNVAAVTWGELTAFDSPLALRTARLPSTGDIALAPRTVADNVPRSPTPDQTAYGLDSAIGSDGTIVTAWAAIPANEKGPRLNVNILRPDGSTSTRSLAGPEYAPDYTVAVFPVLAARPDGAFGLAWLETRDSALGATPASAEEARLLYRVRALTIAANGQLGPVRAAAQMRFVNIGGLPLTISASGSGRTLLSWTGPGGNADEIKTAFDTEIVLPPPPPPAPPAVVPPAAPPAPPVAPQLSLVRFSEKSIAVGQKATFVLTSSEAGLVKIAISKSTSGRKAAGKCVAQTAKNKKKKKCTYDKAIATIAKSYAAGRTSIAFDGKIGKKKLAVGTYKATITVTSATSGLVSAPTVLTFKVKAKKKTTTKR